MSVAQIFVSLGLCVLLFECNESGARITRLDYEEVEEKQYVFYHFLI